MKFYRYIKEMVKLDKKKWSEFDLSKMEQDTLNYLFNMYETTYTTEGLDLSAYSSNELAKKYNIVLFIDIDEDPHPDAFIIYKKTEFGNKMALMGSDGQKESKSVLVKKIFELLKSKGWWIEASGKMETLLNNKIKHIDDEESIKKLIPSDRNIELIDHGYYKRKLYKVNKSIIKRIYGNPIL